MEIPKLPIPPFDSDQLSARTRAILVILFVAAVGIRVFFALYTPESVDDSGKIFPFNDEYLHFAYSQYLVKHFSLPVHARIRNPEDPDLIETYFIFNEAEYAQPPLFYILNAPFALAPQPIKACRIFSVFISTGLILIGVSCSALVFRDKNRASLIAMAFLGFHPVLVRIGSSISNDNLSWLISMMLFRLYLTRNFQEAKWKYGVLIGLGALSRISFLIWPIFLLLKFAVDSATQRSVLTFKRNFKALAVIGFISLLLCGGWLIRNQMIYSDWTGLRALGWRSYLYTGSIYSVESFMTSAMRFSFFPIAEEPDWSPLLVQSILSLLFLSFILQRSQRKAEFEDGTVFRDFELFNLLNFAIFLMTNFRLDYPETRHLFIGLLPLLSLTIAAFSVNLKKAAAAAAVSFNLICLFAFL